MNEELRNKDNLINSLLHQLAKQTECITSLDNRFSNNVSCMYDHVKPNIREFYPKHIILHVGTNGLKSSKTASQISRSVIDLVLSLKAKTNAVTISLIVPRKDNRNNKAQEVKSRLINMCGEQDITFIDRTDTIDTERHLNESKVQIRDKRIC